MTDSNNKNNKTVLQSQLPRHPMSTVNQCFILASDPNTLIIQSLLYLRQARRKDLSPWRQFHNQPEVQGHVSWCIRPGPCAIAKIQARVIQMNKDIYQIIISSSIPLICCTDLNGRPLTVPDRMSWGQQFRRWLLQTRSSVNLTLCRVSSPETAQTKNQWERPHILVSKGEVFTALIHITANYVSLTMMALKRLVPSYTSENQFLYFWLPKLCIYLVPLAIHIYE